jgi:hypothetical protein
MIPLLFAAHPFGLKAKGLAANVRSPYLSKFVTREAEDMDYAMKKTLHAPTYTTLRESRKKQHNALVKMTEITHAIDAMDALKALNKGIAKLLSKRRLSPSLFPAYAVMDAWSEMKSRLSHVLKNEEIVDDFTILYELDAQLVFEVKVTT